MTENLHHHRSHDSLILNHSVQYHHFIKMVEYKGGREGGREGGGGGGKGETY